MQDRLGAVSTANQTRGHCLQTDPFTSVRESSVHDYSLPCFTHVDNARKLYVLELWHPAYAVQAWV